MSTIVNAGPVLLFLKSKDPAHQDNIDDMLSEFDKHAFFVQMSMDEDGNFKWEAMTRRDGGGYELVPLSELGRKKATLKTVT